MTPPPVARWGTRIEDLRDGIRGTVLNQYGMAFAAVMDTGDVRYYDKGDPRFLLIRRRIPLPVSNHGSSVRTVGSSTDEPSD